MSKVGEVYKIKYRDFNRYFQFVSIDQTALNSDVIAVLCYRSNGDMTPDLRTIIESGTEFFTHTTVNAGIKQNLWEKIGKTHLVDFSTALFKEVYYKDYLPDIEPYETDSYHSWVVWHVNGEWQHIDGEIEKYPDAELGAVFPPDSTVYRVEHGRYPGLLYYGQVR